MGASITGERVCATGTVSCPMTLETETVPGSKAAKQLQPVLLLLHGLTTSLGNPGWTTASDSTFLLPQLLLLVSPHVWSTANSIASQ